MELYFGGHMVHSGAEHLETRSVREAMRNTVREIVRAHFLAGDDGDHRLGRQRSECDAHANGDDAVEDNLVAAEGRERQTRAVERLHLGPTARPRPCFICSAPRHEDACAAMTWRLIRSWRIAVQRGSARHGADRKVRRKAPRKVPRKAPKKLPRKVRAPCHAHATAGKQIVE